MGLLDILFLRAWPAGISAGRQHPVQGVTAGSHEDRQTSSSQDCTQQALHIFFQQYSKEHADELANTCVLLICDALTDGVLCWDPVACVLQADPGHWRCEGDAVQEAQAVHLQCGFLAQLVCQSRVPMQAVYDAVCANIPALSIKVDAVKDWLQV